MSIIQIIVIIVVLCVVAWLWSAYIAPRVPAPLNWLIPLIFAVLIIIWLLGAVGLIPGLGTKVLFMAPAFMGSVLAARTIT